MVTAAFLAAGCTTAHPPDAYLFHGPEPILEAFVAASKECGYSRIEKTLGSHLEPMVDLTIPERRTPRFTCIWNWAKAHEREGLTNQLPDGY